jgi:tetratricopeptide (TPR) repeat protein
MKGEGMKDRHFSMATLARMTWARVEIEEMQQLIIPHILALCPTCRENFEELQRLKQQVGHWDDITVVMEAADAPDLWNRLQPLPYDQQLRQVEEDGELQTWALCRLLLRESLEATVQRPEIAVQLAVLAVKIANHLGDAYDREWVSDLRALAFAYLGNARRVLGEHRSADDAFFDAHYYFRRSGTGNARVKAEIQALEASLRRDERRFDEAVQLLDQTIATYTTADQDLQDLHLAGLSLIKKAYTLQQMGEAAESIPLLQEAAQLIDPPRDPRLVLNLKQNYLLVLATIGSYDEATALLTETWELARSLGNAIDLLRIRWIEAKVSAGLLQRGPAEQAFKEVQQAFLDHEMGYDAALVSLDLAILYAREGCTAELKQLALDILPVFSSREIHREAMAALLLFQSACQEELLTVGLAIQLAALLDRERPPGSANRLGSVEA